MALTLILICAGVFILVCIFFVILLILIGMLGHVRDLSERSKRQLHATERIMRASEKSTRLIESTKQNS
jgi:predicted Holliday junction resolvase-like endonuclease